MARQTLFPEANREDPPRADSEPLPLWTNGEMAVSCWRLTWRERLSALLFGRVWLYVLTQPTAHPAVAVYARRRVFPRR